MRHILELSIFLIICLATHTISGMLLLLYIMASGI